MQNIHYKRLWGENGNPDISSVFRSCLGYAACPGFAFIKRTIEGLYGTFQGLNTIELGCGLGKVSLLLSLLGAETTLVDYSNKQLKGAEYVFENFEINSTFVKENILRLPMSFSGDYDISMSFGTAEHFFGNDRQHAFDAHFKVLKKRGLCIIWVPNRYGVLFHFGVLARKILKRAVSQIDETPFTRRELRICADRAGLKEIRIFGGELLKNDFFNHIFNINRLSYFRKREKKFTNIQDARKQLIKCIQDNTSTILPWNNYLSYPLVLIGRRYE